MRVAPDARACSKLARQAVQNLLPARGRQPDRVADLSLVATTNLTLNAVARAPGRLGQRAPGVPITEVPLLDHDVDNLAELPGAGNSLSRAWASGGKPPHYRPRPVPS